MAQGIDNVASALIDRLSITGSTIRNSANIHSGGRTR